MSSDPAQLLFRQGTAKCIPPRHRQMLHGRHWHCSPVQGECSVSHQHFVAIRAEGKHVTELSWSCCSHQWQHVASPASWKFSGYGYLPSWSYMLPEGTLCLQAALSVFLSPETSSPVVKARILTCVEGMNVPLLEQAIQEQRKYFNERQEQRGNSTS